MHAAKVLFLVTIMLGATLVLGGCSPIPDAPGPIGIPGI